MSVILHACPAIAAELRRSLRDIDRTDVDVRMLCGGPEAGICRLDGPLERREGGVHLIVGGCRSTVERLPAHVREVRWGSCYQALAPTAKVDEWLDAGAHLLTGAMLQSDVPVWRHWGFSSLALAAEFAREGMTALVYLQSEDDPIRRGRALRLAADFGLPLEVVDVDFERLGLWLRAALAETERQVDAKRLRRRAAESAFVLDAIGRLFVGPSATRSLTELAESLGMMLGATVEIELARGPVLATAQLDALTDHLGPRPDLTGVAVDREGGFDVALRVADHTLGTISLRDLVAPEHAQEYRALLLKLAPAAAGAIVRHLAVAERASARALFGQVFEQVPSGLAVTDARGTIIAVNRAFERITGYARGEVLGRNPRMLKSGQHDPAFYTAMRRALIERGAWAGPIVNRHKHGHDYVQWLSITRTRGAEGQEVRYIGLLEDLNEERRLRVQMQKSERHLLKAQQVARLGSWDYDTATGCIVWSAQVYRIFGRDPDTYRPDYPSFLAMVHPDDRDRLQRAVRTTLEEGAEYELVHRIVLPDGTIRTVHQRGERTDIADEGSVHMVGVINDITDRIEAERRTQQAASVFEASTQGVVITDVSGRILDVNRAFTEISGYTRQEVVGSNPSVLASGRHDRAFYTQMWETLLETGRWSGEVWNRRKSGETYPEQLNIGTVWHSDGSPAGYVGVFSDVTERKAFERQLTYQALHDPLTSLHNRMWFDAQLHRATRSASARSTRFAVVMLDLDQFKVVNDTMGHQAGDQLLVAVAERFVAWIDGTDEVARIGGDEFAFLLESVSTAAEAAAAVRALTRALQPPVIIGELTLPVTASLGLAMYPGDGETAGELLRNADTAMYHAKRNGRNAFQAYRPEMTATVSEQLRVASALRGAIDRGELRLVFQPELDLRTGVLHGCEVLLRWTSPQLGPVSPGVFIPLAEQTGLVRELDLWVLRTAVRQARAWLDEGVAFGRLWINLAAASFDHPDLVQTIRDALSEADLSADRLGIELTETSAVKYPERGVQTLSRLRALGIQTALDDFGTGYSSLAYLKVFPVDIIKNDRAFVSALPDSTSDRALVQAVLAIGHPLGKRVLAEGVETAEQEACLRVLGCDLVQGYRYARPLPAEELARWRT